MELTGKCKEDFEHWLFHTHYNERHDTFLHWAGCDDSMKWGVYVDFFDSKDIKISIQWLDTMYSYEVAIPEIDHFSDWLIKAEGGKDKLNDTRTAAIKKTNELYNNQ